MTPKRYFLITIAAIYGLIAISTAVADSASDSGLFYMNKPREMQRAFDLDENRRFAAIGAKGFVHTENKDSPMYMAAVHWRGSKAFNVDEDGNDSGLIYEFAIIEVKDRDGDFVFIWGENRPGENAKAEIFEGTGKYKNIVGEVDLGWTDASRYPDGSITRAYDMDWEVLNHEPERYRPDPQEGDKLTYHQWIYRYPHELDENYTTPGGHRVDHHDEEGFYISFQDPESPLHELALFGWTTIVFEEDGDWNSGKILQWAAGEFTDEDGDQIFAFGYHRVPDEWRIWATEGTGKFKGIRAIFPKFGPTEPWPVGWPGEPEVNGMPFYWHLPGEE